MMNMTGNGKISGKKQRILLTVNGKKDKIEKRKTGKKAKAALRRRQKHGFGKTADT